MTEYNMVQAEEPADISEKASDETFYEQDELPFGEESYGKHDRHEDDDISYDCEEPCMYNCPTVDDFLNLTDEMIETIIDLEEELVRWRQALIKYLPKEWADGLRQDIFNNLSRDFEGDPAYDLYVNMKRGMDPQQDKERRKRLYRLADGKDETSITYL